jgi:tetratricopeptide (TPR) repeat protein
MDRPTALSLVHDGWNHLRLQRPLAAWASWQRGLRVAPDDPAARQALATLESAPELPAAARASYRFQAPPTADAARRARWDARLQPGRGLDDLAVAADTFAALADDDPGDADARLNQALALAWLGRNAEAVATLDRALAALATSDPGRAADAWTLAEVLRLGAGAEALADDLRYVRTVEWAKGQGPPDGLFDRWPDLRPVPVPDDPVHSGKALEGGQVFEWLDRPMPDSPPATLEGRDLPRVLATVIRTPHALRLSTPDPTGFDRLDDPGFEEVAAVLRQAKCEAAPLPIAWADAALGTFCFPPGLTADAKARLAREAVEHWFENLWVHHPRHGLDRRSPLQAARDAAKGDAVARAKLSGIVRFFEQLGARPTHAAIYQGYPFDRLRRRLGLIGPESSPAVDRDDVSCMSEPELDSLDPTSLDPARLVDACASSAALGADAWTARFACELLTRAPESLGRLDPYSMVAPLVREALREGSPARAQAWLDRARATMRDDRHRRMFTVWSAEVHARSGRPDEALAAYRSLLDPPATGAPTALDGAETLLDNGYADQALTLLLEARSLARASGDRTTLVKVEALLDRGGR